MFFVYNKCTLSLPGEKHCVSSPKAGEVKKATAANKLIASSILRVYSQSTISEIQKLTDTRQIAKKNQTDKVLGEREREKIR